MIAKIVGIGNSAGIIIPTALLSSLQLKRNDQVVISETSTGFEVRRVDKPKSFEDLLKDYYDKPYDEAVKLFAAEGDDSEVDWGDPVGEEVW